MRLTSIVLMGLPLLWSLTTRYASAQTTPELRAAARAAEAVRQEGQAEAELPPLEVMLEVWGVPLRRPYAFDDADMIRVGVEQELPAPGARSSVRRAASLQAQSLQADGQARRRALALRKAHAVVEHHAALRSHRVHLAHLRLAERTLQLARARHAAGGSLADVSALEVEVARAAALVAADEARARTSLDMLAALRDVPSLEPTRERPELTALRLARDAELAEAAARRARNGWPTPRVGLSYFAPSADMAEHGFGVSLGLRLPWLWGSRSGAEQAAASRSRALGEELAVKQRDLALSLIEARGAVATAQGSLSVLKARVLPATQRAQQLAQAAYQSGQGRLEDVLRAEAQQVDTEMQIVELESELAHRNADLAFALGSAAPLAQPPQELNHDR
jgi:outer membrane protein, heavy metal efflux system